MLPVYPGICLSLINSYLIRKLYFRDRKGSPTNCRDKDFAELSGELSGAIGLKALSLVVPSNCSENCLVLFVRFFGFGFWGS